MRLSEFWSKMDHRFGAGYSASVARDQVLPSLGGRTVETALREGVAAKQVWRAVESDTGDGAQRVS